MLAEMQMRFLVDLRLLRLTQPMLFNLVVMIITVCQICIVRKHADIKILNYLNIMSLTSTGIGECLACLLELCSSSRKIQNKKLQE